MGAQAPGNPGPEGGGVCMCVMRVSRRWGGSVAQSVVAPPGSIPNPVVTRRSAGEYFGGDSKGGEAAAGPPQRPDTPHTTHPHPPGAGWSSGSSLGS